MGSIQEGRTERRKLAVATFIMLSYNGPLVAVPAATQFHSYMVGLYH